MSAGFLTMQTFTTQQADKIRILAAELRDHAAHTVLPEYRAKFEETAIELERAAQRMDHRVRFAN